MYKQWDYRCLVPYSDKDPTKWKTYEIFDYRKASSEEELEKVQQFNYDNNFLNWEDPKVLKYFTKSTQSMKKAWKKTFGYPHTTAIPWDYNTTLTSDGINERNQKDVTNSRFKKCAHYVSPPFPQFLPPCNTTRSKL